MRSFIEVCIHSEDWREGYTSYIPGSKTMLCNATYICKPFTQFFPSVHRESKSQQSLPSMQWPYWKVNWPVALEERLLLRKTLVKINSKEKRVRDYQKRLNT